MVTRLRAHFRNLPLSRKVIAVNLATTAIVLAAGSGALLWYDHTIARTRMVDDVRLLADVVGSNSTAAISFNDAQDARDILRGASADPHILRAAIVLPSGQVLARYDREEGSLPPLPAEATASGERAAHSFTPTSLRVTAPIVFSSERIGGVYVESDLTELFALQRRHLLVMGSLLIGGLALAVGLSSRWQHLISAPILGLTDIMRSVQRDCCYDCARRRTAPMKSAIDERLQRDAHETQIRDSQLREQHTSWRWPPRREPPSCAIRTASGDGPRYAMAASRAKSEFSPT